MSMNLSKHQMTKDRETWHAAVHGGPVGHNPETEQQSLKYALLWTDLIKKSG